MNKTLKKKNQIPSLSMLKFTLIENGTVGVTQLCHRYDTIVSWG